MLHSGSRGKDSAFYKVGGLMGVYGLKTDLPKEAAAMLEMQTEDGTDVFNTQTSDDTNADGSEKPYVPIKKRPVCVLPERAHFAIPSCERFKREGGFDLGSGSSSTTNGRADSRLKTERKEEKEEETGQQMFRVHSPPSSSSSHRHRRKQTIIPRIILKPLKPPDKADGSYFLHVPSQSDNTDEVDSAKPSPDVDHRLHMLPRSQTISEILASLPGFSGKPRRRHKKNKKYGASPFLDFRRKPQVDLETPNSVLANVNLKNLINKHTFASLPPHHQHKLLKMLATNDRHKGPDNCLRLGASALDNEFFARACTKWRERLASGEFTPESQTKLKAELDKERAKVDPWKTKHFEPVWGQSSVPELQSNYSSPTKSAKTPPKIHKASSSSTSVSSTASASVSSSTKSAPTKPQKHIVNHRVQEPQAKIILKISVPKDGVAGGVSILKKLSKTIGKERSSSSSSSSVISGSSSSSQKAKSSTLTTTSIATASPAQYSCSTLLSTMAAASQRQQAAAGGPKVGEVKRSGQLIPPDLSVKRPSDSEESPEKRQRVDSDASPSGSSKTRTLAQIKSQAQLKPVQSQTRTLAQIKAQMAVKAHQGQTRTLAHIKAQTSAKVHARLVPGNAQGAARPSVHSPAILGRPRATSHNWMNLKSIVPSNATSVTGGVGARMHIEGLQGQSKSGSPNKVLTVTVSNSTPGQPVIQTVKPIIIKTQPGLSVVLVSQSNMSLLPGNASRVVQGNSQQSSLKTTNSVATLVSSKVGNNSKTVTYITLPSSKAVASVTPPSTVTSGSSNASRGNQSSVPTPGKVAQISSASTENRTVNLVHGRVSIANGAMHTSTTVQLPGKDSLSTHSQPTVAKVVPLSNNNSTVQNTVCSCQSSVVMSGPTTSKSSILPSGGKDSPDGSSSLAGKCTCRLKAMVMCKGCGAFCHNDCIGPSNLCVSCLIR
eukprot:XP_011683311.1 PREDICTED: putative Polycomb group protein ASXL2 isoform X1 [Strongylocentrotus purpuratus]